MASQSVWIGLDLGLRQTHVCVVDDCGQPVHEQYCETSLDGISETLAAVPKDQIALIGAEAGADSHVVRKLRAAGYPVAIFETRKASKFLAVRRSKTDASDAKGLADMARLGRHTVSQVHLKSLECQQLRDQLVMREKLVRVRVATEGAVRSRFRLYGQQLRSTRAVGRLREEVELRLATLRAEEGIDLRDDLMPLVDVSESLRKYLAKLDGQLEAKAKEHPVCRRLMDVPGVGPICSLSFYSAIEDPMRFGRASGVGAILGLNPRRYQSGDTSYTKGITKNGNKLTRTHLFSAARVFARFAPDCALKEWYTGLRGRAGSRRAAVALARKLAVVLLTIWRNGTQFKAFPEDSRSLGDNVANDLPVEGSGGLDSDTTFEP